MRHLELYLFACGHGDTLLIRLPDDRWVLVDCYLPESTGVRKRFFDFVETKGIDRLAAVFQTHPDYDHFLGMHAVLTHFIEKKGKTIGVYADSGLNVQQIKSLLKRRKRPGRRAYDRLVASLEVWDKDKKLDWRELDAERPPFSPKGFSDRIEFIPIAPDPKVKRRLTEACIEKLGNSPETTLEANELSLVLALAVSDQAAKFNVLLAADADMENIKRAMRLWQSHADERKINRCFNAVKVPHHGSINNHCAELCSHGPHPQGVAKVAAISAGERTAIPDRHVVEEYLNDGWTVMITTIRKNRQKSRAGDLHFKPVTSPSFQENTVELLWESDGTFKYHPPSAVVKKSDASAYREAKE